MSLQFPVEHEFQEGFGCALEYDLRLCFRNLPSRLFYRICSSGGFFFFYVYVAEMPCSIRFFVHSSGIYSQVHEGSRTLEASHSRRDVGLEGKRKTSPKGGGKGSGSHPFTPLARLCYTIEWICLHTSAYLMDIGSVGMVILPGSTMEELNVLKVVAWSDSGLCGGKTPSLARICDICPHGNTIDSRRVRIRSVPMK